MSRKCNFALISGIYIDSDIITSEVNIASTLGSHFAPDFRDGSYDPVFTPLRENTEALLLSFISQLTELYSAAI
jgi:hypothetical protein